MVVGSLSGSVVCVGWLGPSYIVRDFLVSLDFLKNRIEQSHTFSAETNLHEANNLQSCFGREKDV